MSRSIAEFEADSCVPGYKTLDFYKAFWYLQLAVSDGASTSCGCTSEPHIMLLELMVGHRKIITKFSRISIKNPSRFWHLGRRQNGFLLEPSGNLLALCISHLWDRWLMGRRAQRVPLGRAGSLMQNDSSAHCRTISAMAVGPWMIVPETVLSRSTLKGAVYAL